jgi:hypothetical protein
MTRVRFPVCHSDHGNVSQSPPYRFALGAPNKPPFSRVSAIHRKSRSAKGVRVVPGQMQFTLILYGA